MFHAPAAEKISPALTSDFSTSSIKKGFPSVTVAIVSRKSGRTARDR